MHKSQSINRSATIVYKLKDSSNENSFSHSFSPLSSKGEFDLSDNFALIKQVIRIEFDRLCISQKYIGFKYLVDITAFALNNDISNAYCWNLFEQIANINNTSKDSVERDIRHMLSTLWQRNTVFKNRLSANCNSKNINSKCILNALIKYMSIVI